ncbi:MAG: AraC family transcriptional regulator [Lachnospiraceae bacterium]|nr:AraC family transcriptional regulator [Lachnospiraceae bacterium]
MHEPYQKTGYLHSDFRMFYLIDHEKKEFELHYHDFHKILIFLNGNVSYTVEGKYFDLQPDDVVLVSAGEIHRPVIHSTIPYERIVIYLSPDFFRTFQNSEYDLFYCFEQAARNHSSLIRTRSVPSASGALPAPAVSPASAVSPTLPVSVALPKANAEAFSNLNKELIKACHSQEFAASLYRRIKFMEYLILLNRSLLCHSSLLVHASDFNHTVLNIIEYINEFITEDLDIEQIAEHFFLTRFHIMHLFKAETGITIGRYITEKRLFIARQLIQNGSSVTDACYQSGFRNYSAFYRAFKNKYQAPPGKLR